MKNFSKSLFISACIAISCIQPSQAGHLFSQEEADKDTQRTSHARRQANREALQQCYSYIIHHPLAFLYLKFFTQHPSLESNPDANNLLIFHPYVATPALVEDTTNFEAYALRENHIDKRNPEQEPETTHQQAAQPEALRIQTSSTISFSSYNDAECILPNSQEPTLAQNLLANPEKHKKKRKRHRKKKTSAESPMESSVLTLPQVKRKIDYTKQIMEGQKLPLCLPPYSCKTTIPVVESFIHTILQNKIEKPVKVHVPLNREEISPFHEAFRTLVQKYPFPFTWSMTNKGPSILNDERSPYTIELSLSSLAREREDVENKFVYHISPEEDKKVKWSHVYDVAMSSGFTLEDFKFNNAIKIRMIELQRNTEEKNLEELQKFLEIKLPKDNYPVHIVGILINKKIKLPGRMFEKVLAKVSAINPGLCSRGTICDPQSNSIYLCLDNVRRNMLDLHGGRGVKVAKEETQDFIIKAYETFKEGCTVLTGRGNHINTNGTAGVLRGAFGEWIKDEGFASIITQSFPLEGDGGYKVLFPKIQTLDLRRTRQKKHLPQIKKIIAQMVPQKERRLQIIMNSEDASQNAEFKRMMDVYKALHAHDTELLESITPISFESVPGEIKLIFNKRHPQNSSSFTFINSYGSRSTFGTIH